ncbi:MAG: response regulator [Candidatus Omnitrophota bacterium]
MIKKKILFIEDEPDQVMMIQIRLEASGLEMICASDGQEGLLKAKKENPDLILLDLLLPKMNGYEVCKELKQDSLTRKIPIIIITGSGTKDIEEKCLAAGADACIKKPYDSKELVARIKSLLGAT